MELELTLYAGATVPQPRRHEVLNNKDHIDHTNPLGYVLGQWGQIDNLENPWQMPSNVTKLHPLTQSISSTRQRVAPQIPHRAVSQLEQAVHLWAHRNTFQSHPCFSSVTKSFFWYSKGRILGSKDVLVLPSLHLRPLYPLEDQTHEVGTYDTLPSQSHLMYNHLHHPEFTVLYWLGS